MSNRVEFISRRGWRVCLWVLFLGFTAWGLVFPVLNAAPQKDTEKLSKAEKRRQKAIQKELESPYKKWLNEEVPYIITNEERASFKKFTTDDEREQFIENFWERRNPNPGSPENEFKEEYYRRIAYANEHYASGIQGWRTDRGRIYIMYGPPDENDSHPSGGSYLRPQEEGGGETSTYPFEQWRYRYIDGIGTNIILEFVDPTMTGEYHLTMDPGEKDALLHVPNAGLTDMESMGMASKADRFTRTDGMTIGQSMGGTPESMNEFTRLDLYSKIWQPPQVKFNDLKAVVTSKISAQLLPFDVRTDFIRVTDETVLTPITLQVAYRDLEFQNKNGVMHGVMDIYGQVTSLGGRNVNTFEKSLVLDVPEHEFQHFLERKAVYQEAIPLRPGRYKLSLVMKDDLNSHMGSMEIGLVVPRFDENKLSNSSLILADLIQPLPTNQVGTGPFVIGGTKVRPSVNQTFTRDQKLGIYMQVYNLGLDAKTHKPSLDVEYELLKDGKSLLAQAEDAAKLKDASQQFTLEKQMPLSVLQPGKYTMQIKVTDNINKQTLLPSTTFEVQ
ncbi:MAG: GWxTD domain-containing protein [Terriglobia bacterium]